MHSDKERAAFIMVSSLWYSGFGDTHTPTHLGLGVSQNWGNPFNCCFAYFPFKPIHKRCPKTIDTPVGLEALAFRQAVASMQETPQWFVQLEGGLLGQDPAVGLSDGQTAKYSQTSRRVQLLHDALHVWILQASSFLGLYAVILYIAWRAHVHRHQELKRDQHVCHALSFCW